MPREEGGEMQQGIPIESDSSARNKSPGNVQKGRKGEKVRTRVDAVSHFRASAQWVDMGSGI